MTTAPVSSPALKLTNIVKAFGPNEVLKGVDLSMTPGRVTALLGANGAGKSTLIKILAGLYPLDAGSIVLDGQPVAIRTPKEAQHAGIQTVHQRVDETIVPGLSVAENLCFEEIVTGGVPAVRSVTKLLPRAREIAATLDLDWSDAVLRQDVFELGIAEWQLLLLARALVREPKVLILDEPTSALSNKEAERLFGVVRDLRERGVAILYVSHRLSEIRSLADDLVVLRDGQILDVQTAPFDLGHAVTSMLGRSLSMEVAAVEVHRGDEVAVELTDVQLLTRSKPVSTSLRFGEVTGVVGLIGAGKSELARGLYGIEKFRSGTVTVEGAAFAGNSTRQAVAQGIYLVPEDRASEAMLPGWSIQRTVTLPFLNWLSSWGVMNARKEGEFCDSVIDKLDVVTTGAGQAVDALSGGNQQKVVVGRWLAGQPRILLLDEPFRGVDIGARRDISGQVRAMAQTGACVVVLSSDVDEIKEVADRILVLVEGEIAADAYSNELDHEAIVARMTEVA
ncbi:MAG: sugar ABC transporter ATP-binding protein [Arachnia sp.]